MHAIGAVSLASSGERQSAGIESPTLDPYSQMMKLIYVLYVHNCTGKDIVTTYSLKIETRPHGVSRCLFFTNSTACFIFFFPLEQAALLLVSCPSTEAVGIFIG
jgi:hypothetical protein